MVSDDDDVLDMSIVGDEEEQHRIALEHNLQDLSIQLSVSNPSQASDVESGMGCHSGDNERGFSYNGSESSFEVEYPRHDPKPFDISIFDGHHSIILDHPQPDKGYHHTNYSYRHDYEDDGNGLHYLVDTLSTAAHHASAVTLSAGLGRQHGKRAVRGDTSLSYAEYDPDRPLENMVNGIANDLSMLSMNAPRPYPKRTPVSSAKVASDSALADKTHNFDLLQNTYSRGSPARPHTTQDFVFPNQSRARQKQSPKAKNSANQPALNVQPPTPSANASTGNGSRFSTLAKNLASEIGIHERYAANINHGGTARQFGYHNRQSIRRGPFQDVANQQQFIPPSAHRRDNVTTPKYVQLPDVTGLTSAVGSPLKRDTDWQGFNGDGQVDGVEAQLLQTLTTLQTRLNQLESQNLASRRRVRELELELEACKMEVKRERTRVLEREEIIVAQQKDFSKYKATTDASDKLARPKEDFGGERRYQEILEEKKALEALIATLRSHLSRMTTELAAQQEQLHELRALRKRDLRDLRGKMDDVTRLKVEIERLGGEVEALRGIVEEGLKERRKIKNSLQNEKTEIQQDANEQQSEHDSSFRPVAGFSRNSISPDSEPLPQAHQDTTAQQVEKTLRTDFATLGSSHASGIGDRRFVDDDELGRISAEVGERRSVRFDGKANDVVMNTGGLSRLADNAELSAQSRANHRPRVRISSGYNRNLPTSPSIISPSTTGASKEHDVLPETPFPQIRGERLERLFFSAPEHNEKTCRVCHRRRRPGASDEELDFPSWLPPRKRLKTQQGPSRRKDREADVSEAIDGASKQASKAPFSEDRLPPQTVLARIVRELEDDFTHYKGIYIELADQYKLMDAVSNVPKRNVLAEHLKEVINTLEGKGDQIASLYDLLSFKDKPLTNATIFGKRGSPSPAPPRSRRRHHSLRKYATYS